MLTLLLLSVNLGGHATGLGGGPSDTPMVTPGGSVSQSFVTALVESYNERAATASAPAPLLWDGRAGGARPGPCLPLRSP